MNRSLIQQAVKTPPAPAGKPVAALWHGTIADVLDDGTVWVLVPRLGGSDPFGPMRTIPSGLVQGESVLIGAVEGLLDGLFVLARATTAPATPATHTHAVTDISDSTTVGRGLVTAATAALARGVIGAGTSSLALGGTASTAKPGDYVPAWSEVTEKPATFAPSTHNHLWAQITDPPATYPPSAHNHDWAQVQNKPTAFTPTAHTHPATGISDSSTTGRAVVTASSATAARTAIGAGTSSLVLGSTASTAKSGDYVPGWEQISGKPPLASRSNLARTTSITHYTEPSYWYEVAEVKVGGDPAGAISKRFANEYEKTWAPGTTFAPPRENIRDAYTDSGGDLLINAAGWRTSSTVTPQTVIDEIVGCQISNGIIYHNFDAAGGAQGTDALGFKADGWADIYSIDDGDTAQSMVAAGVVDAFSFGPALVRAGVSQTQGAGFEAISARQILGQKADGDVVIITVHGKTDIYGISAAECAVVAQRHGCVDAIMLDGGGSTQAISGGSLYHASSDAATQRPVPAFAVINARVKNTPDTGWLDVPYRAGFTGSDGNIIGRRLQVRKVGEEIKVRGRVTATAGPVPSGIYSQVADVPPHFVPRIPGGGHASHPGTSGIMAVSANDSAVYVQPAAGANYLDVTGNSYYLE